MDIRLAAISYCAQQRAGKSRVYLTKIYSISIWNLLSRIELLLKKDSKQYKKNAMVALRFPDSPGLFTKFKTFPGVKQLGSRTFAIRTSSSQEIPFTMEYVFAQSLHTSTTGIAEKHLKKFKRSPFNMFAHFFSILVIMRRWHRKRTKNFLLPNLRFIISVWKPSFCKLPHYSSVLAHP